MSLSARHHLSVPEGFHERDIVLRRLKSVEEVVRRKPKTTYQQLYSRELECNSNRLHSLGKTSI